MIFFAVQVGLQIIVKPEQKSAKFVLKIFQNVDSNFGTVMTNSEGTCIHVCEHMNVCEVKHLRPKIPVNDTQHYKCKKMIYYGFRGCSQFVLEINIIDLLRIRHQHLYMNVLGSHYLEWV
jgi:hypothetical protein